MAGHAQRSPSSSKRWISCPGSLRLNEGARRKSSVYADEGTVAHEIAKRLLDNVNGKPGMSPGSASLYLGKHGLVDEKGMVEIKQGPPPANPKSGSAHRITQEMADHVDGYVGYVMSIPGSRYIEVRVSAEAYAEGVTGTADAIVINGVVLHVVDLKYGAGVAVFPEENPQAMIYALGALDAFDFDGEIEEVEITIYQPRNDHPAGPVRVWRIKADDLRDWGHRVLGPAALRTEDPNAPVCAGDHCRFCDAAGGCIENAKLALEAAQQEFSPTDLPAIKEEDIVLPSVELMTPEQISKALWFAQERLSPWLKALAAWVQEEMEKGSKGFPDWKLVRKRANREWASETEVLAKIATGLKLEGKVYDFKLKSPAQMEALLKKEKLPLDVIPTLLSNKEAGLTLAHISDKRAAVDVKPGAEFSAIEDDEF